MNGCLTVKTVFMEEIIMTTLMVTAKGQITLKQELLRHLGVASGEKIEVDTLPDGRVIIQAARRRRDIREIFGILSPENKPNISLTIEEINKISQKSWANEE
jgi:bifunctional DNA-binding transcriptional regulator/antitoxin component of YhaV-PrlF toxin-antitoxin module